VWRKTAVFILLLIALAGISSCINDGALFHDRLFIGNQWHEDVIYAFDSSGFEILNGAIKPTGLWYSTNTGLLKLSYNNGDSIVVE